MQVLILGGTEAGRRLAEVLSGHHRIDVVTSLAGRTDAAVRQAGSDGVRVGGFGGAAGLEAWLTEHSPAAVIDATHAFAEHMSAHAATACARTRTPLLRLASPSWRDHHLAGRWQWVPDHAAAEAATAQLPGPILLTVGRQHVADYHALADRIVVARVAQARGLSVPDHWVLLEARGPFSVEQERALLLRHRIAVLVTKDSGTVATAAKLEAAHELGVAVVMVARPADPACTSAASVDSVEAAVDWVLGLRSAEGS